MEGEDDAASNLEGRGFKIVARNVRYKVGEIDIVARRRGELHFVEVKLRRNPQFVSSLEAVTEKKRERIRRAAELFLSDSKNGFKEGRLPACYFSVIGIDISDGNKRIECVLDAFV